MSFCDFSDLIMTSHLGPDYNVFCHQLLDVIKRMTQRLFEINRSDVCKNTVYPVFGEQGSKKHSNHLLESQSSDKERFKNDLERISNVLNYSCLQLGFLLFLRALDKSFHPRKRTGITE